VNDVAIMDGDRKVSTGTVGEVWLRGPNVMKEYWGDKGKNLLTNIPWVSSKCLQPRRIKPSLEMAGSRLVTWVYLTTKVSFISVIGVSTGFENRCDFV
jgi:acyl-CoA synthetase (AMP-forming)/AMP-acid ligase II